MSWVSEFVGGIVQKCPDFFSAMVDHAKAKGRNTNIRTSAKVARKDEKLSLPGSEGVAGVFRRAEGLRSCPRLQAPAKKLKRYFNGLIDCLHRRVKTGFSWASHLAIAQQIWFEPRHPLPLWAGEGRLFMCRSARRVPGLKEV